MRMQRKQRKIKTALLLFSFLITFSLVSQASFTAGASSQPNLDQTNAQAEVVWEKTFGGDADDRAFYAVQAVEGDGYVVAGASASIQTDWTVAWVLRLNQNGDMVWNRTFPAALGGSEFRYIINLAKGFLLVGNVFLPSGDTDGYVAEVDLQGRLLWNTTFGGEKVDKLFSAVQVLDGYVFVGLTNSFGEGESDVWLIKTDLSGEMVWSRTYGDEMDDAGRAVAETEDGYIVAGYTNSKGSGDYDFLLLKIDPTGNQVWSKTFGGAQSEKAYAIMKDADGFVVAGDTRSKGAGDNDACIIKVNSDGDVVWDVAVGGADFDSATCITASRFGGFLVGGFTFSFGNGERDFWLFKLDELGGVSWSCTVGGGLFEEAYSAIEESVNTFVLAGWKNYVDKGPYDYYIAKVNVQTQVGVVQAFPLVGYVAFAFVGIVLVVLVCAIKIHRDRERHL